MIRRICGIVARKLVWAVCFLLPVNKKKIVVSSYWGKGYGDNPKYIVEELLKHKKNYQIVWLVGKKDYAKSLPKEVNACTTRSLQSIYHLATAKVWVDNSRKTFCYKKKNQYYIQTWHGFALKRIEKDAQSALDKRYVKNAQKDSKAIDVIVSDSKFMTNIYRRAFWYNGKIAEWGAPRNDIILRKEQKECKSSISHHYHIAGEKKMVLYAPTFRVNGALDVYDIDLKRVKAACEKRFGAECIMLVRLHPNLASKSAELKFDWNETVDVTDYPDMQVLLAGVDVVISDYSSLMFDFALSEKPCFGFATDIDAYKKDRNFYFALDALPFSMSENNDELVEEIENFDEKAYAAGVKRFFENVGMNQEGNASFKCAALIQEQCGEKGDI